MKISSRGEYGILALIDLSLHGESGPTKIKQIADRQDVPKKYLEQVLLALKKGGFVTSTRGKKGGYVLAKEPEEITLVEILDVLEEMTALVDESRDRPDYLRSFWNEKTNEVREVLDVPLAEVIERKRTSEGEMMYHI
ncbi:MAG: Rrf2 family transcriptional regulator [bacterium]